MEKTAAKPRPHRGAAHITRRDVAAVTTGILGFFIGRAVLFQTVNPFAVSFLTSFTKSRALFAIVAVFVTAGLITRLSGLYLVKYLLCNAILVCFHFIYIRKRYKAAPVVISAVGAGAALVSGLVFAALNSFSAYFALMALLEAALTFFLSIVIRKSADALSGRGGANVLDGEAILSMAVMLGAVLAGLADIRVGGVSLRLFMATLIILVTAYKGGGALASTAGLLISFMLYALGFGSIADIPAFAAAGLAAGALKSRGKVFSVLGFAAGGGLAGFYLDRAFITSGLLLSAGAGALAFVLTPTQLYFDVNASINPVINNAEDYIERVRELMTDRINAFSGAFARLSRTFGVLNDKKTIMDRADVTKLIDQISSQCCRDCRKKNTCWEDGFYDTHQTIFGLLGACEKKGRVDPEDISAAFGETCINPAGFIATANRLYDLGHADMIWNNRVAESRELVAQQLAGVAVLMKDLARELDTAVNFKEDLEQNILDELGNSGAEAESVIVLENKAGKYEVTINHAPCYGKKVCARDIAPAVSRALGRKMKPLADCATRKGLCRLQLAEEQRFRVVSGVARLAKEPGGQSGDSYSFMELKNGQCLLALSDGMGSGSAAREESAAAIELLEDFIESGFEKEMAVKIINSALVLKSSRDSFSTLDICSIDLSTGEAEFIKIGAATTFLLRRGEVSVIKSTSLPFGILDSVDIEVCSKLLKHDDIIVMVTDGITEAYGTYEDKGEWISRLLSDFRGSNPQDLADSLLAEAEVLSGAHIGDDMTVLAARIREKRL